MENRRAGIGIKKRAHDLLFKRPEGLAGLVVISIILSYFILSPSEEEQNGVVAVNESDIQSINLPIPSSEENINVQAPIAQEDEIIVSEIEDVDTPILEKSDIALFETEVVEESSVAIDSITDESTEMEQADKIVNTQISKVKENSPVVKFTEPEPKVSSPKFKSENTKKAVKSWVFAKDSDSYTVQLIGSSNRKEIEKFVKANQKQNNLSYFHTIKNNKSWYVVVTGSYQSFKQAEIERKNLPQHLAKYGAWTRKFLSIQKEITANAEKIILLSNAVATNE